MIDEYRRGIPTYKGENGQTVGMLCETKEQCITDDDGVSLPDKLEGLKKYTDDAYANSNLYTDTKIGELINGAPTTLDTLKEIADAMEDNADVVEALDKAVGSKVDQAEYDGHADNGTIHITAEERTKWNNNSGGDGGNADTVDGYHASEFALASQLTFKSMPTGTNLNDCTEQGFYYFDAHAYNYPNTPNSDAHNGLMIVYKHSADRIEQLYYSINAERMYTRNIIGSATSNWKEIATTADLENYFKNTGGNVYGNINILAGGAEEKALRIANANGIMDLLVSADGSMGLIDRNDQWILRKGAGASPILYGTAEGNLPLNSTGTLKRLDNEAMGGRLSLEKGATMTDLQGNVAVDVYLNQLRIVEVGGNIRGAYIDLTKCGNAVTSEIHHDGNSAKCVVVDTDPGVGASVSYADGTLIFVKE